MKTPKTGIVYHIFCTKTGRAYVGQTWKSLRSRWRYHTKPYSNCLKLRNAIQKYGVESFVVSVLTSCSTQDELDAAEVYWIRYFDCIKDGYNIREGGGHSHFGSKGKGWPGPRTPEFCAKLSAALMGHSYSQEGRIRSSRSHGGRSFVDQYGERYETLMEAADRTGADFRNIQAVLKGRQKTAAGRIFTYVEEVIDSKGFG